MRFLRALPAVAWAALIFWLSSRPHLPEIAPMFPGADKVLHAGAYGVFTLLLVVALTPPRNRGRLVAAVVIATLYGVTDELHQAFVPMRSPDPWDLLADLGGSIFSAGFVAWRWR